MQLPDVIAAYGIRLEKVGSDWWCPCPWHEDKNPSFSVSQTAGGWVFWCFSCKRGGGAVRFISVMEGVSYQAARRMLAQMSGVDLPPDRDRDVLESVVNYCAESTSAGEFLKFADSRGWNRTVLKDLRVGYCGSVKAMVDSLGLSWEDVTRLRLDGMDESVVFPFADDEGFFKLQTRSTEGKAWFSRGKDVQSLWGLDSVHGEKVFVFEGPGDVVVGRSFDVPCVAMCGTSMPEPCWRQLGRAGVREVVFVPDGDEGGRAFLRKMVGTFDASFDVGFSLISGDPDEWLLRKQELPPPVHPVRWWCESRSVPQGEHERISFYADLAPLYSRLPPVHRAVLAPWLKTRYGDSAADYLWSVVPSDIAAERVVLANCLCSEQIAWETVALLGDGVFHGKDNRAIWELVRSEEKPTLQLARTITGLDYSEHVDLENYRRYVDRVRWVGAQQKAGDVLDRARGLLGGSSPDALVGGVIEELHKIINDKTSVVSGGEVARQILTELNVRVKNPSLAGVPMNEAYFPIMNRALLGYVEGKFIMLSGPTGHGKTITAQNLIDDLVYEQRVPVGLVTLEMTPAEIVQRQIALRASVTSAKLVTGSLTQEEYDRVRGEVETLEAEAGRYLHIVHGVYDLRQIVSVVKSQVMQHRLRVVFIDYLQLIRVRSGIERWQQLMEITQTIKNELCSMPITVVAISQLSKAGLGGDVPEAQHQSGSYGMLSDPDVAITLKRRRGSEVKDGSNMLYFIDKHRYGVDQVLIDAVFDRSTLRIREVGT